MANKFQLKRTSVSGRSPNTTNSSNSSFIDAGELAVNLTDRKVFSSTGAVAFEVGSNLSSLSVTGIATVNAITANGSAGLNGQVLTTNGTTVYWADSTGGSGGGGGAFTPTQSQTFTANGTANSFSLSGTTTTNNALVSINGVLQTPTTDYSIVSGNTVVFTFNPANTDLIEVRYGAQPISGYTTSVYQYNISSNTSVITGVDGNGRSLVYAAGLESIFVNGVKLIAGQDYTTPNNYAVSLTSNTVSGDVVEVVALLSASVVADDGANNKTVTTTSAVVVDTFSKTEFRTCKWHIQLTDNGNSQFHATEYFIVHDGTSTYGTEYATVYSDVSLGTVSSNVNGSLVELVITPTYANTTIKTKRYTIGV